MCDWDEADYAEYLLWKESAPARAAPEERRARSIRASILSQTIEVPVALASA